MNDFFYFGLSRICWGVIRQWREKYVELARTERRARFNFASFLYVGILRMGDAAFIKRTVYNTISV